MLASCSTEVDLTAEWQEKTIVYGVLNQNETTHYIKINKSFLGDGNAFEMAAVRDSSEYDPERVNAVVEEYENNVFQRSWVLRDTLVTDKEEGLFYGPEQTVYYFTANLNTNPNVEYRLNVSIDNNDPERSVSAITSLVGDLTISTPAANNPPPQPSISVAMASGGGNYNNVVFKWLVPENGIRFEPEITFKYLEEKSDGSTVLRELPYTMGTLVYNTLSTDLQMSASVDGEVYYQFIKNSILNSSSLNDPSVVSRKYRGLDFKITVAGEELNTYLEVNEPVTGLIQERPSYSNVENGLGIYSSRYSKVVEDKYMNKNSMIELFTGPYTGSLNFCTDSLLWSGIQNEPYYCP
jgi:hypothetical protein